MNYVLCTIAAAMLFSSSLLGVEDRVALQMGGYRIVLPLGWERLNQPTNLLIQQRARSAENGIAISAGAFNLGMSVKQYFTIGVAGLQVFDEAIFQKISDVIGVPVADVERLLKSQIGQQMMEQIKAAGKTTKIDYLVSRKTRIADKEAFETHSKLTIIATGMEFFSRQVVFAGSSPQVIVQITFVGGSKEIFEDKTLLGFIQKETGSHLSL